MRRDYFMEQMCQIWILSIPITSTEVLLERMVSNKYETFVAYELQIEPGMHAVAPSSTIKLNVFNLTTFCIGRNAWIIYTVHT